MADELNELAARCERHSLCLFPQNMRDGHAYHETAWLLDKAAAALRGNTRIEPEAADRGVSEAWQPIETAPTGNEADGPFFDVAWAGHSHRYLPVPAREVDCYRAGNTIKRRHGYPSVTTIFRPQPTHWRPLPDPPAIQSLRSEQEGGQ